MEYFTNPLDKIRTASPCQADWNKMQGDARKRFCGECKLNVYNLSAMTRKEAENLLIESEGKLCVRFYRRDDGTILTQNCPVGWAKIKGKVSKIATAVFSLFVGFFGGLFSFGATINIDETDFQKVSVETIDEAAKTKNHHEIILDTEELSAEEPESVPMFYVGRIDPTAYSHFRKTKNR